MDANGEFRRTKGGEERFEIFRWKMAKILGSALAANLLLFE